MSLESNLPASIVYKGFKRNYIEWQTDKGVWFVGYGQNGGVDCMIAFDEELDKAKEMVYIMLIEYKLIREK